MAHSHKPDETDAAGRRGLQTISTFARAVGLSPSALRQYGEIGLVAPAAVEERTGYRYYGFDQQQRAIWVRRLRDAGLGLDRIRAVLENDTAEAETILDDWLAEAEDRSASIEAVASDVKSALRGQLTRNPKRRTSVMFDAAVLSAALAQLSPAAGGSIEAAGFDGFLLDVGSDAVGIIATDRYLLLARTNVPALVEGPPARVLLPVADAASWLRERHQAELVVEIPTGRDEQRRVTRAWLRDPHGGELTLPQGPDRFPDAKQVIDAVGPALGRVVFARNELLRCDSLRADRSADLACEDGSGRLTIGAESIAGQAMGAFPWLELSGPAVLRIAEAAVGDDLTCDVSAPDQPLVWRAPSQPDFVGLMMPRAS